jgi:hypothetical protein
MEGREMLAGGSGGLRLLEEFRRTCENNVKSKERERELDLSGQNGDHSV